MALQKTIPHASGLALNDAYWMIAAIEHQIINRSLKLAVVGYVSAEHRSKLKAASAAYEQSVIDFEANKEAWAASRPGRERETAYDAYVDADRAMKKAAQAVNDLEALPIAADRYQITGADYAACLSADGDVLRAKVYERLLKQPKWLDAKEI